MDFRKLFEEEMTKALDQEQRAAKWGIGRAVQHFALTPSIGEQNRIVRPCSTYEMLSRSRVGTGREMAEQEGAKLSAK